MFCLHLYQQRVNVYLGINAMVSSVRVLSDVKEKEMKFEGGIAHE